MPDRKRSTKPQTPRRMVPPPERRPAIRKTARPAAGTTAAKIGRKLDAFPDRIDARDWFYHPTLVPLPSTLVNCDRVPVILDQGDQGACTGFALAAVINFHLAQRGIQRRVSPRMLYEMARKYDEWPGEDYEGSSARGAMLGWIRHGVCSDTHWPATLAGAQHLTPKIADEAQQTPGGAFYRVQHHEVRDMHAALFELGALYMTLMVHTGWDDPQVAKDNFERVPLPKKKSLVLPVIQRQGRADDGHAVAIVGYTQKGFIIQNSWGNTWGAQGFALLPYEDFMLHATDVWAAQIGVPVDVNLWQEGKAADTTAGMQRAASIVALNDIRPYVVDCGNNGELSDGGDYWTTEDDLKRLFSESIPGATRTWKKRRVLLYLHGGLNSEDAVARRVIAFREVLLENEIYPLHIMWETGAFETLKDLIADFTRGSTERASGMAEWWHTTREGLTEAKDRTFELTTARAGRALWDEMKKNANLASNHPKGKGVMQLLGRYAAEALKKNQETGRFQLHVAGHSAGSIFAAYALPFLVEAQLEFDTVQFMAPAITLELFAKLVAPGIASNRCPHPTLYILSDGAERGDTVGPYGKSLLYLVSNAFEPTRGTPLLGMEKFVSQGAVDEDGNQVGSPDPQVAALFQQTLEGRPSLVVAGHTQGPASTSHSTSHGGFDNDPDTLNSLMRRILNTDTLKREFTNRDLQY